MLWGLDWIALALAIAWGRPPVWLATVVVANLAAGYWGSQIDLAVFDLAAAALCYGRGRKGDLLAAIYLIAVFANLFLWLTAFPETTTYGILGAIAWVEFGVLGGVDRGNWHRNRRRVAGMADLPERSPAVAMARTGPMDSGWLK